MVLATFFPLKNTHQYISLGCLFLMQAETEEFVVLHDYNFKKKHLKVQQILIAATLELERL